MNLYMFLLKVRKRGLLPLNQRRPCFYCFAERFCRFFGGGSDLSVEEEDVDACFFLGSDRASGDFPSGRTGSGE